MTDEERALRAIHGMDELGGLPPRYVHAIFVGDILIDHPEDIRRYMLEDFDPADDPHIVIKRFPLARDIIRVVEIIRMSWGG